MTIIRAERSLYVWIWAIGGFGTLLSLVKIQNWLDPRSYLVACMVLGFTYAAWRYQVTLDDVGMVHRLPFGSRRIRYIETCKIDLRRPANDRTSRAGDYLRIYGEGRKKPVLQVNLRLFSPLDASRLVERLRLATGKPLWSD